MKFFIFLLVGVSLHFAECVLDESMYLTPQMARFKSSFLEAVKEECYKNSTENYKRFVELTHNSTKCLENNLSQSPLLITPLKAFKDNIQSCFDDFVEELEECLPENSKEWPQLNFDVLYSLLDFVYEKKDQLFAPNVRTFVQECASKINQKGGAHKFSECFNFFGSNTLEVKASCRELLELEKCFATEINEVCPGDQEIEKLKRDLIAAIKEPCLEFIVVTENPVDNVFTLLSHIAPINITNPKDNL